MRMSSFSGIPVPIVLVVDIISREDEWALS